MTVRILLCLACFALAVSHAHASITPSRDLCRLVEGADVIVLGTVTTLAARPSVSLEHPETWAPSLGPPAAGRLLVDEVLKGADDLKGTYLEFPLPADRRIGLWSSQYRVFFLKKQGNLHDFVSPYHPSVPGLPVTSSTARHPMERVVESIAAMVRSAKAPVHLRNFAAQTLWRNTGPVALDTLRETMRGPNPRLRFTAASLLAWIGDVTALRLIEDALVDYASVPGRSPGNLVASLGSDRYGENAVPALTRLAQHKNVQVRRSAIRGLRFTPGSGKVAALIRALDDPDEEVRYSATSALARHAGRNNRIRSLEGFRQRETEDIAYWRAWAAAP